MTPSAVKSHSESDVLDGVEVMPVTHVQRPVWIPWSLATACLVIALGLGTLYAAEKTRRIVAEQHESMAESSLAQTRSAQARSDSLLVTVLAPQVLSTVMTAAGRNVSARIFYNRTSRELVLAIFDLPPAPEGQMYRLWGGNTGRRIDLGLFNPTHDRRAIVRVTVPPGEVLASAQVTLSEGSSIAHETPVLFGSW